MPKRIFTSFAIEDANLRTMLVGQARNEQTPFELVDMSVKQPWDSAWKTNCRSRIKGCDGMIAIITSNTAKADGQLWEIRCAIEEGISVLFLDGNGSASRVPPPYETKSVTSWSWPSIKAFIDRL